MILPAVPDPTPGDLGVRILVRGTVCFDPAQPLWQAAGTRALLDTILADTCPLQPAAWERYQRARRGGN